MTDRPILFSARMVRAIIAEIERPGTGKTQTRRVAKRQDILLRSGRPFVPVGVHTELPFSKPGWDVGDRLWVRETWAVGACADGLAPSMLSPRCWQHDNGGCWYAAGGVPSTPISPRGRWRPGIHMPRWASRLTLTVTKARIERLQDISEADARAEGVPGDFPAVWEFEELWNSINGKRPERAWADNPWVVAVSFTAERRNIYATPAQRTEWTPEVVA